MERGGDETRKRDLREREGKEVRETQRHRKAYRERKMGGEGKRD